MSDKNMTAPQEAEDGLTEAVERTVETIERQLSLIGERAPGEYLDKRPVVQSLQAHVRRLRTALAFPHQSGEMGAGVAYKDGTPQLSAGDSAFESWYAGYMASSPVHTGVKQKLRDAYAAGMGDPLVVAPSAQQDERKAPTVDAQSTWYALVMGVAASLEDAANCLRDDDAQRAAMGAAEHYRKRAKELGSQRVQASTNRHRADVLERIAESGKLDDQSRGWLMDIASSLRAAMSREQENKP